jgi:hypothetical protein
LSRCDVLGGIPIEYLKEIKDVVTAYDNDTSGNLMA